VKGQGVYHKYSDYSVGTKTLTLGRLQTWSCFLLQ